MSRRSIQPIHLPDMTSRLTIVDALSAPAGAMSARAMLMSMTSKIITDPPGPELAHAT